VPLVLLMNCLLSCIHNTFCLQMRVFQAEMKIQYTQLVDELIMCKVHINVHDLHRYTTELHQVDDGG